MVDLAAVSAIGERIVDLLRQRQRADLAARGMAPLINAFDIRQLAAGALAEAEGVSVTCVHIAAGAHHRQAALTPVGPEARRLAPSVALDLSYLIAAHAGDPVQEQAMVAWAILTLAAHPILREAPGDPALALTVQQTDSAELARLCSVLGSPLRLACVVIARDVVLESPPPPEGPPPISLGRRT